MKLNLPLDKMSVSEKIGVMETLWDDLCRRADNLASPDWHKYVLQEREKGIKSGDDKVVDWEEAKKKIRKSIS